MTWVPPSDRGREPLRVERTTVGAMRSFTVRDADDQYVLGLTFRDVMALVGAREGLVHMREHSRFSAWFADVHLEPESDVYGIGYGTLSALQDDGLCHRPLLTRPTAPGPVELTPLGGQVLDLIAELDGVVLPSFDLAVAS
jgi:hypothetical protein